MMVFWHPFAVCLYLPVSGASLPTLTLVPTVAIEFTSFQ